MRGSRTALEAAAGRRRPAQVCGGGARAGVEDLGRLRAEVLTARGAYYKALDAYRELDGGASLAAGDRTKLRAHLLEAHEAYERAQERLHEAVAEHQRSRG